METIDVTILSAGGKKYILVDDLIAAIAVSDYTFDKKKLLEELVKLRGDGK